MIDCLIFTKDRACQLDLLLRSIEENFPELGALNIIYSASSVDFLSGYQILMSRFPDHNWIGETNLIKDIKTVVGTFSADFSMAFVDDELIVRKHDISQLLDILRTNELVHCASLRLGKNVDFTYTANIPSPPPPFIKKEGHEIYGWKWAEQNPNADWGYPSCINSHIYRTELFKGLILKNDFKNVNDLEGMFNRARHHFKPLMICFGEPMTLNVANNLVQSGTNRHSNKREYTVEALNDRFLSGYRIDPVSLYDHETNMATLELDYKWEIPATKYQTL